MIVNNEQNSSAPLEAPLDTRKSVVESPEANSSDAEKAPVISEDTESTPPTEPKKKFSNKKAYKWLYDINYANGEVMTEREIDSYANERISYNLPVIYRKLGIKTPDNDGLASLYESFYEPIEVEGEKKNSSETTPTTSSPSAPKQDSMDSQSESDIVLSGADSGFQSPDYNTHIPKYNDVTLPQLIKESDLSWMTMNERDADLQFEREYGKFGFEAEQTDVGQNRLKIKAPDGTSKTVSLYTDERLKGIDLVNYWTTGHSNTGDYRMDVAIDGLRDWMTSKVENVGIAQLAINNSENTEMTAIFINSSLNGSAQLTSEEQSALLDITGNNQAYEEMSRQGFSQFEARKILNDLYSNTKDESQKKQIKKIGDAMNARVRSYSRVIGGAIAAAPNGGYFDFANNDHHMKMMMSAGMSPDDMSFGQNLLINDRVATYAEAQHLLSDYDGILAVEKRDIKISINPNVQGKIAGEMLNSLAELQERNNATPIRELEVSSRYIQEAYDQAVLAGERILDLGQTLVLSIADVGSSLIKALPMQGASVGGVPMMISKDAIKANDPDFQDLGYLTKEVIKDTREEWLPYYESGITDANSFAEVLAKGGNATMESLPITAMYMMNPEMGLALTFMNGYGETMYSLEKQQQDAKKALGENYTTAAWKEAELQRMANMSRAEQKAYAFTVGGIETGLTSLFTFKYFKGIAGAKNFAGAKTAENAKILANQYGAQFHKGFINKLATSFGVQPKVLALEFTEEESIMMAQYAVDVAWGLKDYNGEELSNMFKETGAQTFFTATGIASLGTRVQNKRISSAVDGFMRGNLTFNAEQESLRNYKTELAIYEDMVATNKKAEESIEDSQQPITYSESQLKSQQELVDKFGAELLIHKTQKQGIIDEMTPEDKYEFLQSMADVKNYANTVKNSEDGNLARAAVPKLEAAKDRARRVMMKYPSTISFDYMSSEQKNLYMQAAVDDLLKNKYKDKDVTASFTTEDLLSTEEGVSSTAQQQVDGVNQIPQSEIKEKAVEIFLAESAGFLGQDGEVRIIENTTRADASRSSQNIPREILEGFNVQEHIDNIRESEKNKGILGDVDLAMEAVSPELKLEDTDAEYANEIEQIESELSELAAQRGNEIKLAEDEASAKAAESSPSEKIEYSSRTQSRISVEEKTSPNGEEYSNLDVFVSREEFEEKRYSTPYANDIALDIANQAQSIPGKIRLGGSVFQLIEGSSNFAVVSKLNDHLSGNYDRTIDQVLAEFYGSDADKAKLRELLEARIQKSSSPDQSVIDEINSRYDNKRGELKNRLDAVKNKAKNQARTRTESSDVTPTVEEPSMSAFEESRDSKLVDRIELINDKTDVLSYLNSNQKSTLVGYLLDVEKGNKTKPGEVENLLDVIDMVLDIQTELGDRKIDIYTKEGNAAISGIINLSLDMYSGSLSDKVGTLATTTVLMQNLFKDSKVGKAFIDLNNEAGRRTDEAKQKIGNLKKEHTESYALSAENDEDYKNASPRERKEMRDPNHINNNYEQMMLSNLRRLRGETKNGEDIEFTRNKSLILQELDIRRSNYEADKKRKPSEQNPKYEAQYLAFKAMVEKLGIAESKSYEDVASRASGRNTELIEKFVAMQPNAEAMEYLERYSDFDVTEMDVYLPSFYQYSDGQTYVDRIGYEEEANPSSTAGQTKEATLPETLSNDESGLSLRLAPGNFFNQMYGSLQGLELEVSARDQYRQISQMMDMPLFQQLFEGNVMNDKGDMRTSDEYNRFSNAFKMRENVFEKDIKSAHLNTTDIGDIDPAKGAWSSVVQAAYSSASALVLTGLTQNIRQYQSAVSGVMPMLTSKEAKSALTGSNIAFYTGVGHATSGVEGKTWTVQQLRKLMGSNAYASNIYAKSRTGMRNSLGSELIVNQNRKMPMSYYLRNFGLVDVVEGDTDAEIEAKEKKTYQRFYNYGTIPDSKSPELYTLKQAMDLISASNEATLELMLANGDRAAANATFEALYIDYRIKQGAKYDKDFWVNENKNPNIDAINYADQKIDETQKQTTSTSQAGLYGDYSTEFSNNITKFVVPFGSFTFNTRSAILANLQKIQDPMLDPEQKQQSRRFLEGKVREIAYFEGLKAVGVVGLYQGVAGLARLFGAIDEDDIERYGGMSSLIGNNLLPIENRSLEDLSIEAIRELNPNESKSTEEYNAIKTIVADGLQEIENNSKDVGKLLMTYENKLKISPYNINIAEKVTQDLTKMMNPLPRPDLADDMVKAMWNYSMTSFGNDDLKVTEFLTQDTKSLMTKDGLYSFIGNNAGILSILGQEYENLNRAITLSSEGMIYKRNTMSAQGVTGVAITSASEPIRERLDDATNMLLYLRLVAALAPGVPKQDVNKVADKMERQLEEIYDAIGTDKMSFDPKDPSMKIKASEEEKEQGVKRNSVLEQF